MQDGAMISPATRKRIETVLKAHLGKTFVGAKIEPRLDADGDPALYISARFAPPDAVPPSSTIVDTMVALRDELLANEDARFPYLRPVYPEEPVSDEAA